MQEHGFQKGDIVGARSFITGSPLSLLVGVATFAQQDAAQPAAAPARAAIPVSTTVRVLAAGCSSTTIKGASYSYWGGVCCKAAFQSNNDVYVVSQP